MMKSLPKLDLKTFGGSSLFYGLGRVYFRMPDEALPDTYGSLSFCTFLP